MKIKVVCNMCGETYIESLKATIKAKLFNLIPSNKRKRLGKLTPLCPVCWSNLFRAYSEEWNK